MKVFYADSWVGMHVSKKAGLVFVFIWFFFGGIAHFLFKSSEMSIVPPWLPNPELLVIVSGIFELAGAVGILLRQFRPLAGLGLVLLTIAVTPANVYMLQEASHYPMVPYWALVARLPLQLLLIVCIWQVTNAVNVIHGLKQLFRQE